MGLCGIWKNVANLHSPIISAHLDCSNKSFMVVVLLHSIQKHLCFGDKGNKSSTKGLSKKLNELQKKDFFTCTPKEKSCFWDKLRDHAEKQENAVLYTSKIWSELFLC